MKRWLPEGARNIILRLNSAGYEASVVGGCVRDSLLGIVPHDWDICTSALPEETMQVFSDCTVHGTGIKHGTVLVMMAGEAYEVTTYRVDGDYEDHRHPRKVTFVRSLQEDLARRDFTINAMAWNPTEGLIDCFGGRQDLEQGLIRCVGEPERRFDEDALRILRALRFAARFDYRIEPKTAAALYTKSELLHQISGERVFSELCGILTGAGAAQILGEHREIFGVVMPELVPMFDHPQHNPHHCYDVWEHTLHAVAAVEADPVLRFTMLLHDAGKPACYTRGEDGTGHFHGHPEESVRLAEAILERFHCSNEFRERVSTLIAWHDRVRIFRRKTVRKMLFALGEENCRALFKVMRADALAQNPDTQGAKLAELGSGEQLLEELLQEQACVTLRDLAIGGRDLIQQGERPGAHLGEMLNQLLEAVIEEEVPNERQALLNYYREKTKSQLN